jgi:tetratricopeptide (TPR) repeat protein
MELVVKKTRNLIFALLLVFAVCPSTHGKEDILSLDAAIKTTAKEISGSFNSGARIAVVKFESPATRLGDYIMEELNGALIQNKRLLVVDRANIEYLEKELKYQKENISEEAAKNIGKWLGAELIVVGSLDNIGDTYRYRCYTINVAKAAREAATMLSVTNDSSFKSLLSGLQNNSNTVAVRSYGGTSNSAPAKSAGDYLNAGITSGVKGDFTNAIANFDQAIKLDPNFALAYLQRGKAIYAGLVKITKMNANFEFDDYIRAIISGEEKTRCQDAIKDFSRAIQLGGALMAAYAYRGRAYHFWGEYDNAIMDYNQIIKINQNSTAAYNNRGASYHKKGDYGRAIGDYSQSIKLDPNYANAYFNRGTSYAGKGDYDKAIGDYSQAIKLDPNFVDAYFNRGICYYFKGDKEKAISDFEKVVQINPNYPNAKNNLKELRGW